jgi:enoyl-CoA hydratase/carnithine racemase
MKFLTIASLTSVLMSGAYAGAEPAPTHSTQPSYFTAYKSLKIERDSTGVLVVSFNTNGGPLTFTARDHTDFVDAFYRISQDRDNNVVILTGAGGDFIPRIDFGSFGNVADPDVWSRVHDEGVQILENLANIHVPVIAAVEGRAYVHSEYALLADIIVAGEGATFNDIPHFAGGIVPGDGIFTTWSYRAGAGRAEMFLLNPSPLSAKTAQVWGVVAEVTRDGQTLALAQDIAKILLKAQEVTRRNTRAHFIHPLKVQIVSEVGDGLALEGASAASLVKSLQAKK